MTDSRESPRTQRFDFAITPESDRGKVTQRSIAPEVFFDTYIVEPGKRSTTTLEAFLRLNSDDQDKIKNVGSYSFSKFKDARRKRESLLSRSAIAFDLDHCSPEEAEDVLNGRGWLSQFLYVAHTTIKHSPLKPRLRVIVFLSRDISSEEYVAVSRIAGSQILDDEERSMFVLDEVSFNPMQVAYFPAVLKGSVYESFFNDEGGLLDPDDILDGFDGDWNDLSQLPFCEERGTIAQLTATKAEDPRKKKGPIGVFCRLYTARDIIERYPDDYEIHDGDRVTYIHGSSIKGGIFYNDDTFYYSNHSTDPFYGRSYNAWDIYRIKEFGHLDAKEGTGRTTKELPSQKAMLEYAMEDPKLRMAMVSEDFDFEDLDDPHEQVLQAKPRGAVAHYEAKDPNKPETTRQVGEVNLSVFGVNAEPEPEDDTDPKTLFSMLDVDLNGKLKNTFANLCAIVKYDPRLHKAFAFNSLAGTTVQTKTLYLDGPKGRPARLHNKEDGDPIEDIRLAQIREMLSRQRGKGENGYGLEYGADNIANAIRVAGDYRTFHPVRERMLSIYNAHCEVAGPDFEPDMEMVETFFIRHLGCEDNVYTREACRIFVLALISRTFEPGCHFDHVVTLQGAQGSGKTTFWKILAFNKWHTELGDEIEDQKKLIENVAGFSIVELGEGVAIMKTLTEALKMAISRRMDSARKAFDRNTTFLHRSFVFVMTTNAETYLRDPSGHRRFWPIKTDRTILNPIDFKAVEREWPLVIANAMKFYMRERVNGPLYLTLSPESIAIAKLETDEVVEVTAESVLAEEIGHLANRPLKKSLLVGGNPNSDYQNLDEDEPLVERTRLSYKDVTDLVPSYRNLYTRTISAAMNLVEGWIPFSKWSDPKTGECGAKNSKFKIQGIPVRIHVRKDATKEEIRDGFRPVCEDGSDLI